MAGARRLRTDPIDRMLEGAWHLATHLDRVPVLVLACIRGRMTPATTPAQASALFGSIYPAVWSLQLALRSRGLASTMTTVHIERHQEMADLLGIPDNVTQAALVPVAHLVGDDLRRAHRRPVRDVAFRERWGGAWDGPSGSGPSTPVDLSHASGDGARSTHQHRSGRVPVMSVVGPASASRPGMTSVSSAGSQRPLLSTLGPARQPSATLM